MLGNPEPSEYVAAPHAVRPRVAAVMRLAATKVTVLEVRLKREDSQRLLCLGFKVFNL